MAGKLNLNNTLFWRLSLVFLTVLIIVGMAYVLITGYSARQYYQETHQRLNADVAASMLLEVTPFVDGEVNEDALGKIMHSMMAVNPSLEVYLLDPEGEILSHVVLDKEVRLKSVSLDPVREFVGSEGEDYILGDDPRNPGEETIFSASEVREDGRLLGYVYMVLDSEKYQDALGTLWSSYFLRVGTRSFVITLVAAFGIGLLLIAMLTSNLRKIQRGVKRFEEGDYASRIEVDGKGELADLAVTFNHMADTIVKNIDELKEVDRLRRDLIANVSHDLRSPMSVIHGYIETLILKDNSLSPEDRNKYLQVILQSSEKLKKLVADLFELSRLEARQVKLKQESFFIHELLQDTARQYELMAQEKEIDIRTELTGELPMVYADISLIGRVLQNLIDNAMKYTPDRGEIRVKAEKSNDSVQVEIANSGQIAEKDLPNIFDRYYKVDHKENGISGSGLGLAIVRKILDMHNVTIQVSSRPEEGTRFYFDLPLTV